MEPARRLDLLSRGRERWCCLSVQRGMGKGMWEPEARSQSSGRMPTDILVVCCQGYFLCHTHIL